VIRLKIELKVSAKLRSLDCLATLLDGWNATSADCEPRRVLGSNVASFDRAKIF